MSLQVKIFTGSATAWDAWLDSTCNASAYQYSSFLSPEVRRIQICEGNQIVAAGGAIFAPLLGLPGKNVAFHRGPAYMGNFPAVAETLANWAFRSGAWSLSLMPDTSEGDRDQLMKSGWIQETPLRTTLRMDLTPSEETILAAIDSSGRYKVRRAEREGIRVYLASCSDDILVFCQLYSDMNTAKKLQGTSKDFLMHISAAILANPDRGALLMADYRGEPLGGIIIWRTGLRAEYLYGATRKQSAVLHGDVTAGYPLQWAGIQWAKNIGCVEYDLGGYDSNCITGPARMKRLFSRNVVTLMPRLRKLLRPRLFVAADKIRTVMKRNDKTT